MAKRFVTLVTLLAFVMFTTNCSTAGLASNGSEVQIDPNTVYVSKKMPKALITTSTMELAEVKLVSLQGDVLSVLPAPYSDPGLVKIKLDDLYQIGLFKKKSQAPAGALLGCIFGILAALIYSANDSEHFLSYFFSGMFYFAPTGTCIGLTGTLGSELATKTRFNCQEMPLHKKIKTLKRIMGIKESE